jgi:ketosteroid isomerase-like protein
MSDQNLAIVRQGLDLLQESHERGTATDALLELCAPDIRVDASGRVFNPDVYEGVGGVRRSIRETCDAWEDFHEANERFIDVGDRVVVLQTIGGRGRASRVHVEQQGALIWTVRDGLVRQIEIFSDQRAALKAARLEE